MSTYMHIQAAQTELGGLLIKRKEITLGREGVVVVQQPWRTGYLIGRLEMKKDG